MTTHSSHSPLPEGTRIGRSALRVSALDVLAGFYRDVVGLQVLNRTDATAVLGVDDTPLLVLEGDPDAPSRDRSETGLYHNAFRVPSRGALGDALQRIRKHSQLEGAVDHHVSEALYLSDPEDNGIEIYRDRPREAWPRTDDGRIRMGTDRLDLSRVAADAASDDRAPPGTTIGHVHLEVSSLEAFRDFYVDILGFEMQATVPRAVFVSAGGYHHHLAANTWHDRKKAGAGRGLSWFEVVVPDSEGFEAVRRRLADRGMSATETDEGVTVSDPDDIEVRLRVDRSASAVND